MKKKVLSVALSLCLISGGLMGCGNTNPASGSGSISGEISAMSTDGVITDIVVAGQYNISDIDGLLDLSELDLIGGNVQSVEGEVSSQEVLSSANGETMLAEARLLKEQVRAENKETFLEIINSDGLSDEQKQEAVNAMVQMTAMAEKEAAAELLLEARGFSDVMVTINDGAVDVVVNALTLTDVQRAQIEDIVKRKTGIGAENIVISTVVQE